MNFLKREKLESYWVSSAFVETLSVFLDPHAQDALSVAINLICGGYIDVTPLTPQVNYVSTNRDTYSILHFLVHTGYLTYQVDPQTQNCRVFIPNKELLEHWNAELIPLAKSFTLKVAPLFSEKIKKCLIDFDPAELAILMQDMLYHCSFHDTVNENSYHMFFFGCFSAVIHDNSNIVVSSNKEAGKGRFDLRVEFRALKPKIAVVFEFKKSKTSGDLEKDAKAALEQCKTNQYAVDLGSDFKSHFIGVSFHKKEMSTLHTFKAN